MTRILISIIIECVPIALMTVTKIKRDRCAKLMVAFSWVRLNEIILLTQMINYYRVMTSNNHEIGQECEKM